MTEKRVPCPACKAPILEGARKCRACKKWLVTPSNPGQPRFPRSAIIVATATATVMAVIVTSRESPVGEAPPLTLLPSESAAATSAPAPAAFGPEPEPEPEPVPADPTRRWKVREIPIGDVHPLDIAFHPKGTSIYVSADDGTLREYKLKTGEFVHKASVPAQGDKIRLLFDRYIAVLRREDAARIPVLDTSAWDRDPVLLDVGESPGDIVELPDGRTVIAAATESNRVARFDLPTGTRLANIVLPHSTGQLFLVKAEKRPYIAAMGALLRVGRPAGAWIDLFDPSETPFGATRRSISVGREPRPGAVTKDGEALFFPDRVSNTATLLRVAATTEAKQTAVGQSPEAGFLLAGDRYGVTINSGARTASVIELSTMKVQSTLMLSGVPRMGSVSPDRSMLFVALGGSEWPPKGSGVNIIAGDPPKVVATLETGKGAISVAVAKDGSRAAVASYYDRSITILEQ